MAITVHQHYFYVPHRIVWDEFEDVVTGNDTTTPWPTVTQSGSTSTLLTEMGMGEVGTTKNCNALPVRAYNKVWNEFFRDQKIQSEISLDTNTLQSVNFPASEYLAGVRTEIQQGAEETVTVSGGTFNVTELRDAMHRQRFRERRSQFGERYYDYLLAMGIRAPSSRLDRPEHVARSRSFMGISEVVATATSASENTGEYRGHGILGMATRFPRRNFVEHGTLLGLTYLRPRLQIRHKVDPLWLVSDKDDLYQMELARDTQVPVYHEEVASFSSTPTSVWA